MSARSRLGALLAVPSTLSPGFFSFCSPVYPSAWLTAGAQRTKRSHSCSVPRHRRQCGWLQAGQSPAPGATPWLRAWCSGLRAWCSRGTCQVLEGHQQLHPTGMEVPYTPGLPSKLPPLPQWLAPALFCAGERNSYHSAHLNLPLPTRCLTMS